MEPHAPDEETMVKVAVTDLDGRFESIDRSRIEATVRPLVRDLFERARVKTFVGIIAERRARSQLKKLARETGTLEHEEPRLDEAGFFGT